MEVRIVNNPTHKVDTLCGECQGTGLYVGFSEAPATAQVCLACKGSGKYTFQYIPFKERVFKEGIRFVFKDGVRYSIEEFLENKIPGVNNEQGVWIPSSQVEGGPSIVVNPKLK